MNEYPLLLKVDHWKIQFLNFGWLSTNGISVTITSPRESNHYIVFLSFKMKSIIPSTLVGHGMIKANSALPLSLAIYYIFIFRRKNGFNWQFIKIIAGLVTICAMHRCCRGRGFQSSSSMNFFSEFLFATLSYLHN